MPEKKGKKRPRRVYKSKKGRLFIKVNGRKVYLNDVDRNLKESKVIKIILNMNKYYKRIKPTHSRTKPKIHFQQPILNKLISSGYGYDLPSRTSPAYQQMNTDAHEKKMELIRLQNTLPHPRVTQPMPQNNLLGDITRIGNQLPFISQGPRPATEAVPQITNEQTTEGTDDIDNAHVSATEQTSIAEKERIALRDKAKQITQPALYKIVEEYFQHEDAVPSYEQVAQIIRGEPLESVYWETIRNLYRNKANELEKVDKTDPLIPEYRKESADAEHFRKHFRSIGRGGRFSNWKKGLYDDEIQKIMQQKTHKFVPVIMADEIPTLVPYVNKETRDFGFVINNETSAKKGEHWMAFYINIPRGEIDFYDPLVSQPTKRFMEGIKLLVDKIDPDIYLKLKVNMVRDQNPKTSDCGFFCCRFLTKMLRGDKFARASMFDNSVKGEQEIQRFKNYI